MSKFKSSKHGNQHPRIQPISVPQVFVTSEDDDTPPTRGEDYVQGLLSERKNFGVEEDTASTAPLLESGAATPLNEEPTIPLNLGTFLASSQKLKGEICSEQIGLASINGGDKDVEDSLQLQSSVDKLGAMDCCIVKWPWKYIRIMSAVVVILAIGACFASSATMIAHLPQKCDPLVEWWQGKVFYEIHPLTFADSDGDGYGDLNGITSRLDYLHKELHIDAIRLNSIFHVEHSSESADVLLNATVLNSHLGDEKQFHHLVRSLEKRNMSLIIDLSIDELPTLKGHSHIGNSEHSVVNHILETWVHRGVHGFYLKGLAKFAHHADLWKSIAKWKTTLDRLSSASKNKRNILVTSSAFLVKYSLHHPLHAGNAQKQFDLIDHFIDVKDPSTFEHQITEGLRWDGDVNHPWIMWNVGALGKARLADHYTDQTDGCAHTAGMLMFALSLPGSPSIYYGDEIGLQSVETSSSSSHETISTSSSSSSTPAMQWADNNNALPSASSWLSNHTAHPVNFNCANGTIDTLKNTTSVRREAVPLYVNTVIKYNKNEIVSRSHNYLIQILNNATVVLERFYPRRNRYLLVVNFGTTVVHHDLSSTYFGGQTLVSSSGTKRGYIKLSNLSLVPGEGVLLLLDK